MATPDEKAANAQISRRRDQIQRLARVIRDAKEIAASIDSDRATSWLMIDDPDYVAVHIAADLAFLEQRLAELAYGGLKDSDQDHHRKKS